MKKQHFYFYFLSLFLTSTLAYALPHLSNEELAEKYAQLGDHFATLDNSEKAEKKYRKALSIDPTNTHALVKLGNMFYAQKDPDKAIEFYERAVQLHHNDPHMHFNLGLCYQQKEEWQKAAAQFWYTTELDPTHLKAYLDAAVAYEKTNQFARAIIAVKKALAIAPDSFQAWHQLGNLYRDIEQIENAIEPFEKALSLQPENLHVMMDLANAHNILDHFDEALEGYKRILEHNANAISALYNFGYTLKKMGKIEEALEVYKKVLEKKPDYAPVHFSLASVYLTLGDFENGLKEYEWRWKAYSENPTRSAAPEWKGESLDGKTLLVYSEQGLGDTLQFIRYLKLIKQQYPTAKVILESQPSIVTLLHMQPYIDQVIPRQRSLPTADYTIHLLSIPYVMKTRMDSIPADIPYIAPDADRAAYWKEKLATDTNFKIGICWQGNARYSTLALRRAVTKKSIPLQTLKPLFELENVSIYSLQQVDGLDQIKQFDYKNKLICFDNDFDSRYGAFMDTAAVINELDLVISVDTGLCHLAGAMGVPTWIVLPYPADWRWFLHQADTPWYPSAQLFRQPTMGDWSTPVQEMKQAIQKKIAARKTNNSHIPTQEQKEFFTELVDSLS